MYLTHIRQVYTSFDVYMSFDVYRSFDVYMSNIKNLYDLICIISIHVCSVRKAHFLSFKTYVMFDTHSLSFTALVMFATCILFHLKCLYCLRHAISVIQNINNVHNTHSYYNAFCTSQ